MRVALDGPPKPAETGVLTRRWPRYTPGVVGRDDAAGEYVDARERLLAIGEIAAEVMRDARIVRATIRIAKPHLLDGATPAVTIYSERG